MWPPAQLVEVTSHFMYIYATHPYLQLWCLASLCIQRVTLCWPEKGHPKTLSFIHPVSNPYFKVPMPFRACDLFAFSRLEYMKLLLSHHGWRPSEFMEASVVLLHWVLCLAMNDYNECGCNSWTINDNTKCCRDYWIHCDKPRIEWFSTLKRLASNVTGLKRTFVS